jgi:nucleoside-diphosphate kinase
MERTLSIVKPDAVDHSFIGKIINHFESEHLKIAGLRMLKMSRQEAAAFYKEHEGKKFFNELMEFMTSSPVVVMVLEGENAVSRVRELMGATDPNKAAPNTIRRLYATSFTMNAVHGSDSQNSAKREINFFFKPEQIFDRQAEPHMADQSAA